MKIHTFNDIYSSNCLKTTEKHVEMIESRKDLAIYKPFRIQIVVFPTIHNIDQFSSQKLRDFRCKLAFAQVSEDHRSRSYAVFFLSSLYVCNIVETP